MRYDIDRTSQYPGRPKIATKQTVTLKIQGPLFWGQISTMDGTGHRIERSESYSFDGKLHQQFFEDQGVMNVSDKPLGMSFRKFVSCPLFAPFNFVLGSDFPWIELSKNNAVNLLKFTEGPSPQVMQVTGAKWNNVKMEIDGSNPIPKKVSFDIRDGIVKTCEVLEWSQFEINGLILKLPGAVLITEKSGSSEPALIEKVSIKDFRIVSKQEPSAFRIPFSKAGIVSDVDANVELK